MSDHEDADPTEGLTTERTGGEPPDGRQTWSAFVLRWTLELVVVFVGVYAAFALAQYREGREEQAYREQIEEALAREIEAITDNTRRVATQIPRIVATYDSLIAVGARPDLAPMIEPVRFRSHMWDATLESGGLDVLDVSTLYVVSQFYNQLNAGFEQLSQLRDLSETMLIPNLERGPDEFYESETGGLRARYEWYLDGLRRLGRLAGEITELGEQVVAELDGAEAPPDASDEVGESGEAGSSGEVGESGEAGTPGN